MSTDWSITVLKRRKIKHTHWHFDKDVCKADNWSCASDDKNRKVLNFKGLKGCKSNFGHFSSKYEGISLFQFDITELFNIELME